MPALFAALPADDAAIMTAIVGARLLVPLLIPRIPLAILAAFLLDAIDNGLLGAFTRLHRDGLRQPVVRRPVRSRCCGPARGAPAAPPAAAARAVMELATPGGSVAVLA